jgi:hypothetical protein
LRLPRRELLLSRLSGERVTAKREEVQRIAANIAMLPGFFGR